MTTWDGGISWDGGITWVPVVGDLSASTDALAIADSGGAVQVSSLLAGQADAVDLVDAGGSANLGADAPVESSSPDYEASATGRSWAADSLEAVQAWPVKLTGERVTAQFDFTPDLQPGDAPVAVVMTVTTVDGVDAAPAQVLYGLPQIKGRRVFQKLQGGLAGCVYLVQCQVTTRLGDVLLLARLLPVRATYVH